MMLKTIIFILTTIYATLCFAQKINKMGDYYWKNVDPQDWFDGRTPKMVKNLKGEIIELTQFSFDPSDTHDNQIRLDGSSENYTLLFNIDHEIIKETSYKRSGRKNTESEYIDFLNDMQYSLKHFNENGSLVREERNIFENGILISKEVTENGILKPKNYDVLKKGDSVIVKSRHFVESYFRGRIVEKTSHSKLFKINYSYHENGKIKEQKVFKEGRLTDEERYSLEGFLILRIKYRYNSDGLLNEKIESEYYFNKGLKKKLIETTTKDEQSSFHVFEYEYNMEGFLTDTYRIINENRLLIGRNSYNEFGDLISKKNEGEEVSIINYKYDKNDNWTYRELHYVGGTNRVYKRIFKYK